MCRGCEARGRPCGPKQLPEVTRPDRQAKSKLRRLGNSIKDVDETTRQKIEAILGPKAHPRPRPKSIKPRIVEAPRTYTALTIEDYPRESETQNDQQRDSLSSFDNWPQTHFTMSTWPQISETLELEAETPEFEVGVEDWINEVSDWLEPLSSSMISEVEKEILPDG